MVCQQKVCKRQACMPPSHCKMLQNFLFRVLICQKNQNESYKFCYYTPGFYFPSNLMKLRYIKLISNINFKLLSWSIGQDTGLISKRSRVQDSFGTTKNSLLLHKLYIFHQIFWKIKSRGIRTKFANFILIFLVDQNSNL